MKLEIKLDRGGVPSTPHPGFAKVYACGKPHDDERLTDLLSCHFGSHGGKYSES